MRVAAIALSCLLATSCSTIVDGSHEDIRFATTPPGATVTVDNRITQQSPCTFELERDEDHFAEISMEGYKTVTVEITHHLGGTVFGNLILGGLIGGIIDGASGAAFTLHPDEIDIVMQRGFGTVEYEVDPINAEKEEEAPPQP